MKKRNEIKIVKTAVVIINTIALITTGISFYIEDIYMLYFNMGMLSVLLLLLVLIIILDQNNRKEENNDN